MRGNFSVGAEVMRPLEQVVGTLQVAKPVHHPSHAVDDERIIRGNLEGLLNQVTGFALVCPITNQEKGYPFEVPIPAGLSVRGVVLADQIRSLDWKARKASLIGKLPAEVVEVVIAKIDAILYPA